LEELGFNSRQGQEFFLFSIASKLNLGPTQTPVQCKQGVVLAGVKRYRRGTVRSPVYTDEVKNCEAIGLTPLPPYVFVARCLKKQEIILYRVGGTCRVYRPHHSVCNKLLLPTLLVGVTIIPYSRF
jgi:hypothetical protein